MESNVAIYAAANNLYGITNDQQWLSMMDAANNFVSNMFDDKIGAYYYGTINNDADQWDTQAITANCQTFKILSGADSNDDRNTRALQWVLNNLITYDTAVDSTTGQSYHYIGVRYSNTGTGINSESTAAAAMAFAYQANRIQATHPNLANVFLDTANNLLNSLKQMQKHAPNTDGQGIVATPNPNGALVWAGNEFNGDSWRYFPLLHSAATAWTGCTIGFIEQGDEYSNPFSSYWKKSNKKFFGASVLTSYRGVSDVYVNSTAKGMNTAAVIFALMFAGLLFFGFVALTCVNIRIYRKNKELQDKKDQFSRISFVKLPTSTPQSPRVENVRIETNLPRAVYASPVTPVLNQEQTSFLE